MNQMAPACPVGRADSFMSRPDQPLLIDWPLKERRRQSPDTDGPSPSTCSARAPANLSLRTPEEGSLRRFQVPQKEAKSLSSLPVHQAPPWRANRSHTRRSFSLNAIEQHFVLYAGRLLWPLIHCSMRIMLMRMMIMAPSPSLFGNTNPLGPAVYRAPAPVRLALPCLILRIISLRAL